MSSSDDGHDLLGLNDVYHSYIGLPVIDLHHHCGVHYTSLSSAACVGSAKPRVNVTARLWGRNQTIEYLQGQSQAKDARMWRREKG